MQSKRVPLAGHAAVVNGVLALALAAGCTTHPSAMQRAKTAIANPGFSQFAENEKPFTTSHMEGEDGLLWFQERARANQLLGRTKESSSDYETAWEMYEKLDDKPVVSLSDAGAKAGSLLLSDLAIPYEGNSHERVMIPTLDAFNRIASLDWDAAGADVRRLSRVSELERDRNEKRVKAASEASGKDDRIAYSKLCDTPAWKTYVGTSSQLASNFADAFQNGYAWYLTGLYKEMSGDPSTALTAYQRALDIAPANSFARQDVNRMKAVLDGAPEDRPDNTETDVVVFFEEGYAPQKATFSFLKTLSQQPVPVAVGPIVVSFSFPYYPEASLNGVPVPLQVSENNRLLVQTEPAGNFQALAQKAYEAQMPYILTRAVIRAIAKSTAATAANVAVRRQDTGTRLVTWLAGIFIATATDQPDLRSWLLLPRFGHVARFRLPVGDHDLQLTHGAAQAVVPLTAPGGATVLLHVMSADGRITVEATGMDFAPL